MSVLETASADKRRWTALAALGVCAASAVASVVSGRLYRQSSLVVAGAAAASPHRGEPFSVRALADGPRSFTLVNRFASIPPQCYTKTRDVAGAVHDPCLACHTHSQPPNFVDDAELQRILDLPAAAAVNPWTNLLDPPMDPGASGYSASSGHLDADDELLEYVRRSNYLGADGTTLTLARTIDGLADEDPGVGWRGFRPDAWFSFDDRGFDHRPDGAVTGWRALAYTPFPGTFFPTNGSMDDVLVRLDPALQEDESGRFDRTIYEVNLAIVEALVKRKAVPIDPVDENVLRVDLDLDGKLGRATRVAFDGDEAGHTRMHYVGRARLELEAGRLPIAPGLFPVATEFLHSVRYLDVGGAGSVTLGARMKELRYAKKYRWLSYDALRAETEHETLEQSRAVDGVRHHAWHYDRGIANGQGWLLQGFIEAADGELRPQTFEESEYCTGCHGGIGATTDSIFSLPRKLGAESPQGGWFHWTQYGLQGVPEPRTRDGDYEYTRYLQANAAGDEFRENDEVMDRFFEIRDGTLALRSAAVERLHGDVSTLLLPSAARAFDLDRAYHAIVETQSFTKGRDAVLAPTSNVYVRAPSGLPTGIEQPLF